MGKPVPVKWINPKLWRQAVRLAVSGLALPMVALLLSMAPARAQVAAADSATKALAQPGGPGTPQDFAHLTIAFDLATATTATYDTATSKLTVSDGTLSPDFLFVFQKLFNERKQFFNLLV